MALSMHKTRQMKKTLISIFAGVLAICVTTTQVSAQKRVQKENSKVRLDSLSPEQKKAFRQKLKARYDSLPPEEKEKIRQDIMNRVDSMPAGQKRNLAERLRARKKDNG